MSIKFILSRKIIFSFYPMFIQALDFFMPCKVLMLVLDLWNSKIMLTRIKEGMAFLYGTFKLKTTACTSDSDVRYE
ncbi:hypothetical protein EUGRSUZ_C00464 [Eucalyptus grandis]|uniref:Uncharacterized protein n=2 Tax=Eucalyptus grandis TaxID=71139 RepID=A0A059CLK3_EUCGR|nr:hypothetical protein EUGRSUZ_C00464 [Eucalyptus grandis]